MGRIIKYGLCIAFLPFIVNNFFVAFFITGYYYPHLCLQMLVFAFAAAIIATNVKLLGTKLKEYKEVYGECPKYKYEEKLGLWSFIMCFLIVCTFALNITILNDTALTIAMDIYNLFKWQSIPDMYFLMECGMLALHAFVFFAYICFCRRVCRQKAYEYEYAIQENID